VNGEIFFKCNVRYQFKKLNDRYLKTDCRG